MSLLVRCAGRSQKRLSRRWEQTGQIRNYVLPLQTITLTFGAIPVWFKRCMTPPRKLLVMASWRPIFHLRVVSETRLVERSKSEGIPATSAGEITCHRQGCNAGDVDWALRGSSPQFAACVQVFTATVQKINIARSGSCFAEKICRIDRSTGRESFR